MSIYAIGDLHLSGAAPKPMDIFGDHWTEHWSKIKENWMSIIVADDLVLIPGDLSWAMKLEDAAVDINEICSLPGKKLLLKGNHDYWWSSLAKVNSILSNDTHALQNSSYIFGDHVIAGSRGWVSPGTYLYDPTTDEKLYLREAGRLELSLIEARRLAPDLKLICMMHFPPADKRGTSTMFTDLFEKYGAVEVVYGHLHSSSISGALSGNIRGVNYTLVSCDAVKFSPVRIF